MPKKKPMTLDGLARLVAGGFEESKANLEASEERIRKDMVTKLDLHDLEDRLTNEIRTVYDQVTCEDAEHLHEVDAATERRFQGIEERLGKLEKQAG